MFSRVDPVTQSILTLKESDQERAARYQLNWLYYKGHQYIAELGKKYTKEQKLFKYMRRVFDCVTHCVDTDARFIMRSQITVDAKTDVENDILDIWHRSNFQTEKYKLARYGANLGDAFLIVQDIGDGNAVIPKIVVANSEDMTIEKDPDDQNQVIWAKQSYVFFDDKDRSYTRDWIYWPDRIECFTDGKMDEGYPRPHPFGEVPVIHIKLIDIGEAYGLSSWHNVQSQIDEVNELGSFSNRILLRYADPTIIAKGMQPGTKPTIRKGLNDDNVYYLPDFESDMGILEYQGNVLPHILEHIEKIEQNIKDQLPEMSLAKIREQAGLSGYAVSLHAAELIAKIEEFRGNFSDAIEWANSLCLRAMKRSSAPLEEFENRIEFEPVLPEDPEQTMRVWQMEFDLGLAGRQELWRRQGLSDKEIELRKKEVDDEMEERLDQTYGKRAGVDIAGLEAQLFGSLGVE